MMQYEDYTISLIGRTLSCGKITVNKYDNKVVRLIFDIPVDTDGNSVIGENLWIALSNPVTKKYSIYPLMDHTYTISTRETVYPGKWSIILIALADNETIENNDVNQSTTTFISDVFSRLVVIDNFLNEDDAQTVDYQSEIAINELLVEFRDHMDDYVEHKDVDDINPEDINEMWEVVGG